MNDRIRELALQAEEYATTRHPVSKIVLNVDAYLFEQKFAELIVQECSGFVYNYPERYLTRGQAREICQSMEEHFGVEE
jgi:hypothetical protein